METFAFMVAAAAASLALACSASEGDSADLLGSAEQPIATQTAVQGALAQAQGSLELKPNVLTFCPALTKEEAVKLAAAGFAVEFLTRLGNLKPGFLELDQSAFGVGSSFGIAGCKGVHFTQTAIDTILANAHAEAVDKLKPHVAASQIETQAWAAAYESYYNIVEQLHGIQQLDDCKVADLLKQGVQDLPFTAFKWGTEGGSAPGISVTVPEDPAKRTLKKGCRSYRVFCTPSAMLLSNSLEALFGWVNPFLLLEGDLPTDHGCPKNYAPVAVDPTSANNSECWWVVQSPIQKYCYNSEGYEYGTTKAHIMEGPYEYAHPARACEPCKVGASSDVYTIRKEPSLGVFICDPTCVPGNCTSCVP